LLILRVTYTASKKLISDGRLETIKLKLDFIPRTCPLCGGDDAKVMVEASIDETRLTASAFASRKLPEYMHSRMVECNACGMLYANPVLRQEDLADAYKDASFDSGAESRLAAVTYRALLEPHLNALPSRTSALDIGAGDGAFVEELLALEFTDVVGVEPSTAPIAAAKPAIRGHLQCGIFAADQFAPESLDLITCFQVIEHVWDPVKITSDALALLKPGGLFFIVAHDRRAMSALIMGTKSPIFDIEHLQLFDKPTGTALLRNAGFDSIKVTSVHNKYPVDYWLKLFPLPGPVKSGVRQIAKTSGIGNLLLSLPAGNLAVVGQKPLRKNPGH
jgi:2-polyprenyl-3-methyl-5-hydroxy-6-metoxy-1,4-benzoquinol methylase